MSSAFVVKSTKVLAHDFSEPKPASILIEHGKIQKIFSYTDSAKNIQTYDYADLLVMSGLVDTHAHINEPGRTEWEGFVTATRAAAAGGITTVIDMPLNSIPATTSVQALKIKEESAYGHCTIDYGFWGGVIPGNLAELEPMIKLGVMGFKCFLCPSGVDEFPHVSKSDLEMAMPILAKYNIPLIVHAELESPVNQKHLDARDYKSYLESRPQEWEVDAIRMMIELAEKTKCKTHIVHLSAARALPYIKKAKEKGLLFTAETCPHYLVFCSEEIAKGATHFKCAPPIREKENCDQLWQGLREGLIEFIVSDHSPCTPKLKLMEQGDFSGAWGGIAGLQFSLQSVWTEMKQRGFSTADLSRLMSYQTARFLGIDSKKGQIRPGNDADLIVWDPEASQVIEENKVEHRHKVTPYLGKKVNGIIHHTYVRGHMVYNQGQYLSSCVGAEILRTT